MNSATVIVAIGSIAALALWLFKRYGSADAEKREHKKRLRVVRKAMRLAAAENRISDWDRLNDERLSICQKLNYLRR